MDFFATKCVSSWRIIIPGHYCGKRAKSHVSTPGGTAKSVACGCSLTRLYTIINQYLPLLPLLTSLNHYYHSPHSPTLAFIIITSWYWPIDPGEVRIPFPIFVRLHCNFKMLLKRVNFISTSLITKGICLQPGHQMDNKYRHDDHLLNSWV